MIRRAIRFSMIAVIIGFAPSLVSAATTGKIAGTVTDASGVPIPGVAVTVQGTRLGATVDVDGRYVILQVPPGTHVIAARMIGYRTVNVTDVEVRADRTATVDFSMSEEAIEMDAVVVTSERPPIERDVTSSLITIDARRVADAPVATMLDFLSYEPGVDVSAGNELSIRGGGASEIRFQVDGLDRTDGLTGKAFTQLNQVLVAEVTVLTGGFNAEYGNVRSGMVNVVVKDGTEHGGGLLPWVSGAATYAPAQQKHFGPGVYDEDQYDYWLLSSASPIADSAMNGALYWPLLYEQTREDPAFNDPTYNISNPELPQYRDPRTSTFREHRGWESLAATANAAERGLGAFGYTQWTAEKVREVWEWEANMNETSWQYANEPDFNVDLATGMALPNKYGGIVLGYRRNREMTIAPALRPYFDDESIEAKLTLTPTDNVKIRLNYMHGSSASTGAANANSSRYNPELAASGAGSVIGADPLALRSASDLIASISSTEEAYNKLNLSNNGYLDGKFNQYGLSMTYTLGPKTFFNASIGRSGSTWDLTRDLPRANIEDFESGRYDPITFGYGAWLDDSFDWTDTDDDGKANPPTSLDDATNPDRVIFNAPFNVPNKYTKVPGKTVWVTKDFAFEDGTSLTAVSPQGWVIGGYPDLSGVYKKLGSGGDDTYNGDAAQWVLKSDLTHVVGNHTLKTGLEYITSDLEYHIVSSRGTSQYTDFRDYGGDWPAAQPTLLGYYLQDKMETNGMIANFGVRVERFDAGHPALLYNDLFNTVVEDHGRNLFYAVTIDAGWDTAAWGNVPNIASWNAINDSLQTVGSSAPTPGDIIRALPQDDNVAHWRVAPRFGISHPVSQKSKLFFNYGIFYSMQKPSLMYGHYDHDGRFGGAGSLREIYNPNLRPAKTTMYEVGLEQVLPFQVVTTLRAYAKYNVDQAASISLGEPAGYSIYRNSNYEDIRGAEIKVSRNVGKFVNGWFSYEKSASRTGEVGVKILTNNISNAQKFEAFARSSKPQGYFRAMLNFSTPMVWGAAGGGWSLSFIQSYQSGGEVVYNPDPEVYTTRDLTDENYLPKVDYWNTDLKLSKRFTLGGRRSLSVYMDVTNLWNTKRLNLSSGDYTKYVYYERLKGRDIKYGEDTYIFTQPYQSQDGYWQPPLSPRLDWALFLNPRYYRFGVRFDL